MRALPYSRTARQRFHLDDTAMAAAPGTPTPGTTSAARAARLAANLPAARRVVAAINATRRAGEPSAQAGELAALELLHEIFHLLVERAAELQPPTSMDDSTDAVEAALGEPRVERLLDAVGVEFPDVDGAPEPVRLEELLLIRMANENPAARPLWVLVDDAPVPPADRSAAMASLEAYQASLAPIGPNGETLVELLRAPARAHPTSLAGQLRYVREHWRGLLGDALDALLDRLLLTLDVMAEEERGLHLRFGGGFGDGGGRGEAPDLSGLEAEPERFSSDSAWMPRLVLIAKSTHVWLDQLSRRYRREIRTLDAIPDEELDRLARWGITGLWLIGLWERSAASQRIKQWRGNPDAAASAYSLDDYAIAWDLGGEAAWANLRGRAWARGIRLSSDMVPNHMGIDFALGDRPPGVVHLAPPPALPRLHVRRREPRRARPGRDPARGPLLGQHRRRGDVRVAGPLVGRAPVRLPRQRRHELPVERHRPARLLVGGRAGAGHPDHPVGRPPVPGHPLRRRDGPRPQARAAAVVPGPRRGRRRDPVAGRVRDDDPGGVRRRHARRVLARGRRPRRGGGARHPAARGGVLAPRGLLRPHARDAPRLQQRVHAHAPRRGQRGLPAGAQGDARVRPRDPQALRQLHEQPRREDGGRAVREGRQVHRCRHAARHAPRAADAGPRPVRGLRREVRDGVPAGDPRRAARRVAHRPARARDRAAPPPAGRLRRGARLPAVRRRVRRRRHRRERVRLLQRQRRRPVAGRVPQPVRRDLRLDPRLGRVRGQGRRRVEGARSGARSPRGWASRTATRSTGGSPSASSARRWSTCDPSRRSASAGCTCACARTRHGCSGTSASCTTRPGSGGGWRRGSARAGCRRSRTPSASSSSRPCTSRCAR